MGSFRASILATVFLASACGGAPAAPVTPPAAAERASEPAPVAEAAKPAATAATAAPDEAPPPAHDVWKDGMTKDEEVAFMKKNVVPEMGPVFKAFDAKRYAEFSCKTCHGPKFQLPKDFLPKLTFSKEGKLISPSDEPALAKFMGEEVVPH